MAQNKRDIGTYYELNHPLQPLDPYYRKVKGYQGELRGGAFNFYI